MGTTERLLQFIDFKGDSKYKFYKKTGLSNGFLDKNRNIGSDKCEIISDVYPDLSLEWLITGKGEMLKSGQSLPVAGPANDNEVVALLKKNNALLEKNVAILEENKALLQAENKRLKADIEALKSAQSVAVNQFNQPSQTQPFVQPQR